MSTLEHNRIAVSRLRSSAVIAGSVLLTVGVAAAQGSATNAVLRGGLMLVLVPCGLIDLERRIIPNRITAPAALLGLALGLALDPAGEPERLLSAALAGGFLLVASLANPGGLGMGDAKLLAVMGLFLGPAVLIALLVALLSSLGAGVVVVRRVGDPLVHAYLHHM
jgi:leader peptidase (prepilin peptidase)/N-methyltransferase